MTGKDQGAESGQTPYEPTLCDCGHLSPLHELTDSGHRGPCSASYCNCRRFTEPEGAANA